MQIESFAIVLAQILHIRGLSTPVATSSATDTSDAGPEPGLQAARSGGAAARPCGHLMHAGAAPVDTCHRTCGHLELAADGTVVSVQHPAGMGTPLPERSAEESAHALSSGGGGSHPHGGCSRVWDDVHSIDAACSVSLATCEDSSMSRSMQHPVPRVGTPRCARASRNLIIISNRDRENSPEYSEFLYLCGNCLLYTSPSPRD